jgi:hypothetical protein
MLLRADSRLFLGVWVVAGLAFPATAQQSLPPQNPAPRLLCEAFTRDIEGEWFATRDVTVLAVSGSMLIRDGQRVDDQLQEHLDDQCGTPAPSAARSAERSDPSANAARPDTH